jgi:LCP family protein required for cell wall assembly
MRKHPRVARQPSRLLRRFVISAIVMFGLVALALHGIASLLRPAVVADPRPGAAQATVIGGTTLLVLGIDARDSLDDAAPRSDTLLLVRLEPLTGRVALLSLPRDTRVTIADYGDAKINAAYAHGSVSAQERYGPAASPAQGGMALAAATVASFLDTPVDAVLQIDFTAFARVVDALGGITITVPRRIVDDAYPTADRQTTRVVFEPGEQQMDGATALRYVRTRHADSDFGRAERQQQVVAALLAQLRGRAPLGAIGLLRVAPEIMADAVRTTLPLDRADALLALALLAWRFDPALLERFALVPETVPIVAMEGSDIIWEHAAVRRLAAQFRAGRSAADEQAQIQVLNGTGTSGLARRVSEELAAAGLLVLPPADAARADVARSTVYLAPAAPLTSRAVAERLGIGIEPRDRSPDMITSAGTVVVVVLGADMAPR